MDISAEEIVAAAEDLRYLREWGQHIPGDAIRRGSSTLRLLLLDGLYSSAWRGVGFDAQPKVVAVDLKRALEPAAVAAVDFAFAGGAVFRGFQFSVTVSAPGSRAACAFTPPLSEDGYPCEREFWLSEYLESPAALIAGEWISRREVIQYVAYVKVGVHPKGKKASEKDLAERLTPLDKRSNVQGVSGLLVELVAIGQAIARSADAARLISEVARVVPRDQR